jgi:glucose-6-phosphate dehydrogenase assembly protein OpcA
MSAAASPAAGTSAREVEVDLIEDELRSLWLNSGGSPAGVTRTCRGNLIVFTCSGQEAERARADIPAIMRSQRVRVIDASLDPNGSRDIKATVSIYFARGEEGKELFSEHIALDVSDHAARRIPSIVRTLILGDLPTTLWWAADEMPNLNSPGFQDLSGIADHVVIDSGESAEPRESLRTLAAWMADERAGFVLSDIAWKRLEPWRLLLSQTLQPMLLPAALRLIRSLSLESGLHGRAGIWLLTGWLGRSLGWQFEGAMGESGWAFRSPEGPLQVAFRIAADWAAGIRRVSLAWNSPQGPKIAGFHDAGRGCLKGKLDDSAGAERTLFVSAQTRAALVSRVLSNGQWDACYSGALSLVRQMAGGHELPGLHGTRKRPTLNA